MNTPPPIKVPFIERLKSRGLVGYKGVYVSTSNPKKDPKPPRNKYQLNMPGNKCAYCGGATRHTNDCKRPPTVT